MIGSTSPASATWFADDVSVQQNASSLVSIANNVTSQTIDITRNWSINDILVIDTFNKTVQVNGADVAFSGAFPIFPPSAATFGYSDGFITRNFTFNVVYAKRYF